MNAIIGLASGVVCSAISNTVVDNSNLPWWVLLLIAIIPPIVGALIDIVKNWLINKKLLTQDQADQIEKEIQRRLEEILKDLGKQEETKQDEQDENDP